MNNKIEIDVFDRKSISDAISTLRKKQDEIEDKYQRTVQELTQIGYEYLMSIIKVGSGELAGSISWEYDEKANTGKILVGSDYAIFVEYGTGIRGRDSRHPEPAPGWVYDHNDHGVKGWSFKDRDGSWHTTQGQPASAFMYRTLEYMKQQAGEVLRVNMYG